MIIPYYPWEKSRAFHEAALSPDIDVAAMITGARYGKTIALVNEAIQQVLKFGHGAKGACPRYICYMVAPTYGMVTDILMPTWFQFWPAAYTAEWSQSTRTLTTVHGAQVLFRTAEKFDRIRGTGPSLICLDEAREMKQSVFTLSLARVADRRGKVLVTTTPNGFDWTYDLIEVKAQTDPRIHCSKATAYDRPTAKRDSLARLKDLIGQELYDQEVDGKRVSFKGRVYRSFDYQRHVREVAYNADYPLCIAIDFNVNPISAALMHPTGSPKKWEGWAVFDECVMKHEDTDGLAQEILRRYPKHKGGVLVYPDPSGAYGHTSSRGRSDHSILREYFGSDCIRSKKKAPFIRDRIAAVNRLFRREDDVFLVDPRCKVMIKGLTQLAYKGNIPDEQLFEGHITAAFGYAESYERPFTMKGLQEAQLLNERQLRHKANN